MSSARIHPVLNSPLQRPQAWWQSPLRWARRLIYTVLGIIVTYALSAAVLGLIPMNRDFAPDADGIPIYLTSNGVHADIVVPVDTPLIDWRVDYPTRLFPKVEPRQSFIAFGWGDRGFYLNTERWEDLTLRTAVLAVFGLDRPAMHVEYCVEPTPGKRAIALKISPDRYRALVTFIRSYAERNERGAVIPIEVHHYGRSDTFFEAKGTYSALMTSNEWTRRALYAAGIRAPMWAPLDAPLFYHLRDLRQQ